MFLVDVLLYFTFINGIYSQNILYYTDRQRSIENNHALQYNCLHILDRLDNHFEYQRIVPYCMNENSSVFEVQNSDSDSNFTFVDLKTQSITSEQLYLWSAPIDLIENYQNYLDTNNSILANSIYFNCSSSRFGPQCQYEICWDCYDPVDQPTITCYEHLQCDHPSKTACLDWSEICNGRIDCSNNAIDEQYCLEMEINQCEEDEYRCMNGQCIPKSFKKDITDAPECSDQSDEYYRYHDTDTAPFIQRKIIKEQGFWSEDLACEKTVVMGLCNDERRKTLLKIMFSIKDQSIHDNCSSAFRDLVSAFEKFNKPYGQPCAQMDCLEMIEEYCPEMLFIPSVPVASTDIYVAYRKIDAAEFYHVGEYIIHYICTNNSQYFDYFKNNYSIISFQNQTCFRPIYRENYDSGYLWIYRLEAHISAILHKLNMYQLTTNYTFDICNREYMYQCQNSLKCISIYRIKDSIPDCPYKDDENDKMIMNNIHLVEKLEKTHFKCLYLNIFISYVFVNDNVNDCQNSEEELWWEDEMTNKINYYTTISFQTTCNERTTLIPQLIDGRNETDETECQYWPCDNVYTHCNGIWECPQGVDEIGCLSSKLMNCPSDYTLCLSPQTFQYVCLSKENILDGKVDCVGATDEPHLCEYVSNATYSHEFLFYCLSHSLEKLCLNKHRVCNNQVNCYDGSDEHFCKTNVSIRNLWSICSEKIQHLITDYESFLCQFMTYNFVKDIAYFQLIKTKNNINLISTENTEQFEMKYSKIEQNYEPQCLQGLALKVRLNDENNSTKVTCLCSPYYYGDKCQYQNQRIFLSIQFRAFSDSLRTIFTILISLIDNSQQRTIHSYEQITFVSSRDCGRKYHLYLIYSTRPKDPLKTYSIHIDFYEKISSTYRGSILLPIHFPFLPVHRLAFIVQVPKYDENQRKCSNKKCYNGQCTQYANQPIGINFCRCNSDWTGHDCTIKYLCTCAMKEFCIGITAQNQSICVCPMNKFGPRCFLTNTICQGNNNSFCHQHGDCLPKDETMIFDKTYSCICQYGYSGKFCEISDKNLTLIFENNIISSPNIYIHLIQVIKDANPLRSTLFRLLQDRQKSFSIQWSLPFHVTFVEIQKKYYLAYLESNYNRSLTTIQTVQSTNRCPNITEIFNQTIAQLHLIRRIKYYHLPCQNSSLNLSCFHDENHLCLCETLLNNRVANCLEFDYNMKYDCQGQNECEYNAGCLQDDPKCPTRSMCICPLCYYGSRCQFSTNGFGLSLDAILGYNILPNISLTQQPVIVQFSFILTIVFLIIGLINGILCILTFKNKHVLEVGCGLYLLYSSITTLLVMITFTWKFFVLLFTQMTVFSNQTFLLLQCYTIDFLLRIFILFDQWLNACVAIERTITVVKGISFNKKTSLKSAKIVIVILLLLIIATSIHDPIHRDLINEQDENYPNVKRKWCIVRYSSTLQYYNSIIQSIHFVCSFAINILSAIIIIVKKSHQEQILYPKRDFRLIIKDQIEKHRSILISPLMLALLALPRLIIVFVSKCMQSANDSWFYLISYFVSFLPVMLTFIVFVLPSTLYGTQFRVSMERIRRFFSRFRC